VLNNYKQYRNFFNCFGKCLDRETQLGVATGASAPGSGVQGAAKRRKKMENLKETISGNNFFFKYREK
jgi:hypothetical protein